MSWIYLFVASLMEIIGIVVMKYFILSGKRIFIPLLALIFLISFSFLSWAMQELSMATAYALWTGIGAGGGVIITTFLFKEEKNFTKFFFLSLIIVSSIGLKTLV
ncbi:SMR family transporter [Campylobacter sp. MIT 21-1685]|uniref:DMT family transporter n=1 Tax=unclassified Campylobacter TaxID=2593542 RepID=UPI00224A699C|nr:MULTISPECIES: SMR family transporter [unclassified Campylobacter]MCX2683040.1 SMR family transporter [Campylobacter sp. MIT 21-1684]MCX2751322.1 SMR family transporter [Campylobacter sp. MIT 21-1682]MCX2807521.1 SMR family transporter [Campylobacter sp. MIT 21-1685]